MKKNYCVDCGKEIYPYKSKRCKNCANKNSNHPNWKGKKDIILFCEDCGRVLKTIAWGKRHPKYCPDCKQKGKRSPNWKGGISPQRQKEYPNKKYKEFVKTVLARDNYTCQECNIKNGCGFNVKLEVHHIKSYAEYSELRFDISNSITLCKECHLNTLRNQKRPNRIDKILIKKVCVKCHKEFSKRNPRLYCDDCKKSICQWCDKIFTLKNGKKKQKFCSRSCYSKWDSKNKTGKLLKSKEELKCKECNKIYLVKPSLKYISKFCSLICRAKWQSKKMIGNDYRKK